jgi:hypothetical protein
MCFTFQRSQERNMAVAPDGVAMKFNGTAMKTILKSTCPGYAKIVLLDATFFSFSEHVARMAPSTVIQYLVFTFCSLNVRREHQIDDESSHDRTYLVNQVFPLHSRLAQHVDVLGKRRRLDREVCFPHLDVRQLSRAKADALALLCHPRRTLFHALHESLDDADFLVCAFRVRFGSFERLAERDDDRDSDLGECDAPVHGRAR